MPLKNPEARRLYQTDYRQRPTAKLHHRLHEKKYRHSLKGSKQLRKHLHEYRQRPYVKRQRRDYLHRPEVETQIHLLNREYRHSPIGKELLRQRSQEYRKRPHSKLLKLVHDARHREKGFSPLCPNIWSCPVDYHHVSPTHPYVVPLPRAIHRAVGGQRHYVFNASMTCFFYGLCPS